MFIKRKIYVAIMCPEPIFVCNALCPQVKQSSYVHKAIALLCQLFPWSRCRFNSWQFNPAFSFWEKTSANPKHANARFNLALYFWGKKMLTTCEKVIKKSDESKKCLGRRHWSSCPQVMTTATAGGALSCPETTTTALLGQWAHPCPCFQCIWACSPLIYLTFFLGGVYWNYLHWQPPAPTNL